MLLSIHEYFYIYLLTFLVHAITFIFMIVFKKSLKKFGVLNVTYFAYHLIPIRDIETDMPRDFRVHDWYCSFEPCSFANSSLWQKLV